MDFNNGVFQYENKLKIFKIMSVVNVTPPRGSALSKLVSSAERVSNP